MHNKHLSAVITIIVLAALASCGPASTPPPGPTQVAATSTPQATPTMLASPTPTAIPLLITPPLDSSGLDACALVPQEVAVEVVGGMDGPPEPYFTFGVNDDPPLIFACDLWGETASASLRVWVADSVERAEADFARVRAAAGDQAQPVGGAGDEALWWPQAIALHARQGNARVWVSLPQAFDGAPVAAHRLASAALAGLMQDAAAPPTPGPDPAPESLTIVTQTEDVTPPDWNAMLPEGICALVDQEVWSRVLNGISRPPTYSTSIGEGIGQAFSCSVESADGGATFTLMDFGGPAGAYRYYIYTRPSDAVSLPSVDGSAFWSDQQKLLGMARGNILLTLNLFGDRATADNALILAGSVLAELDEAAGK